jgi:hypothetical protein
LRGGAGISLGCLGSGELGRGEALRLGEIDEVDKYTDPGDTGLRALDIGMRNV